jgi:hypothetical protein
MHRTIVNYYVRTYEQDWTHCDLYGLSNVIDHAVAAKLPAKESRQLFTRILTTQFVTAIQSHMGWLYSLVEDLGTLAIVEPALTAQLCYMLILDRPPISLVIQKALRLLVKLHTQPIQVNTARRPRWARLQHIVAILSGPAATAPALLLERLAEERTPRLRSVIALALAETGDKAVTPRLMEMLRQESREASWAAADALIALQDRTVIPALLTWYQQIQHKNDAHTSADKERILYILGWMQAQEATVLKANAWRSSHERVIGRGVDLCWLLPPVATDQIYLREQLQRILASSPQTPDTLGPWADEWLQKRLVRTSQHLRLVEFLPQLRQLQAHVQARPMPLLSEGTAQPWQKGRAKRERLLRSLDEAITMFERRGSR